jgi:TPP-dependent pyruvate/acetoin dehydrogenase alpha subunit
MSDIDLELYRKLYLIRYAEERIIQLYSTDAMKTPMHMSMGGEAISVGVCSALKPTDQVFGTYRSHALYLAKTGDTDNFFLEMYGKKSNIANGRNGSMHLCSLENELLCSSAIVGSTIPVAVGAAFANKYLQNGKMVAVFFGDGAVDEGVFWESLNFACLKKLPILFVYEDNDLAVHSFNKNRQAFLDILNILENYDIGYSFLDGTDAEEIYARTEMLLEISDGPMFIQCRYHRYLEHVGVNEDYDAGYRNKSEYDRWCRIDPLKQQLDLISMVDALQIEKDIRNQVNASIEKAQNAEFVNVNYIYDGVFK